jgi:hypothetical protein
MKHDPITVAHASDQAYVHKAIEGLTAENSHFTSPLDSRIDRAIHFARCWSNSTTVRDGEIIDVYVYFGWEIPRKAAESGLIGA